MSSQPNTPYHPVDTGYGHQDDLPPSQLAAYRDTPSPAPESPRNPPINVDGFTEDDIARPRFLGHAAGLGTRGSVASSFGVPSFNDNDNTSSVYALNPLGPNRDSTAGYSSVPFRDDPHDSDFAAGAASPGRRPRYLEEKRDAYAAPNKSKRKIVIGAIAIGVTIAAIAIVVALYFTVIRKNDNTSSGIGGNDDGNNDNNNNDGNNDTPTNNLIKSGGDGSTITFEDGTQMTYSNKFGGTWYWDSDDPFNNNAQAQSWTPPLNQSFKWGEDRVYGSVAQPSRAKITYSSFYSRSVNLGGWLVPEPVSFTSTPTTFTNSVLTLSE